MSEAGDVSLAELITREQRGFRRILLAGLVTLLIMLLTSAALGYYLYTASASLRETTKELQKQAFDIRRRLDNARNRIASQEREMRRIYEENRGALASAAPTPENLAAATDASRAYLLRGRVPTLQQEGIIRALSLLPAGVPAAPQGLYKGVIALMDFDASDDSVGGGDLPPRLKEAQDAFEIARADAGLRTLAAAGVGWVQFRLASADRRNYRADVCNAVLREVEASVPNGVPSPQPLYWRAQCRRMLGNVREALPDYARAVRDSAALLASEGSEDIAELTLASNASTGLGAALISVADLPSDDPSVADAVAAARSVCATGEAAAGRSERMALAIACLERSASLREQLKQTANQISRTREIIGFAHLRDDDYAAAFRNAQSVENDALFQRNELVRALSASKAQFEDADDRRAAASAAADARLNLALFRVGQFNMCDLQALMKPAHFEEARALIAAAHPDEEVSGCQRR